MKRCIIISLAAILACFQLTAASVWEGSAALSAYGDFPSSGFYAASISFPRNTVVDVKNLENGKTAQVIITKGTDTPGILLMLSPEAAQTLGIPQNSIARVRVSIPKKANEISALTDSSSKSVNDLDKNPSSLAQAEVAAASKSAQAAPSVSPSSELVLSDIAATPPAETRVPEPASSLPEPAIAGSASPESPSKPNAETEAAAEIAEPAEPAAEIAAENAEVMGIPETLPVTGGIAAVPEPTLAEPAATAPTVTSPTESAAAVASGEFVEIPFPSGIPNYLPIEETSPKPETSAEEKKPSLETVTTPIPDNSVVSLEPTEPSPPPPITLETVPAAAAATVVSPEPALPSAATAEIPPPKTEPTSIVAEPEKPIENKPIESAEAKKPASLEPPVKTVVSVAATPLFNAPVVEALQKGKAYVQIGAFAKPDMVSKAVDAMTKTYPVVLVRSESGVYRVLIGPLGEDEAGAVLIGSRASGYPDSFVRREK
jgi:hypothetical protein